MRPVIEDLGGKMESAFLSFGDYDAIGILQMPDNISAAALSMAIMAGGAVTKVKTIPLMPWSEGLAAMQKAKKAAYPPPKDNPMINRT